MYDSSLITAIAAEISDTPVKTFTIGFGEKEYNEAVYAADVAAHLGTDHTERYIDEKGNEFLVGYYPPMFYGAYQIRNEGNKMNLNSREMPAKVYYEMTSEDGNAHILFISGSVYHHIDNTNDDTNADKDRYDYLVGIKSEIFPELFISFTRLVFTFHIFMLRNLIII